MRADSALVDALAPSPNFGDRRGRKIDALILHYTGMASGEAALARLIDPASNVSCHYLVWEDGRITQLVAEGDRAWHAGLGCWAGERDMNSVSLGIEIVNAGHDGGLPPYPDAQIDAVIALCHDLCTRHAIAGHRVLAHSDIAPARKRDPGERFPWQTLAAHGVGFWAAPPPPGPPLAEIDLVSVQRRLQEIGYACPRGGTLDQETTDVLTAFQRRYRPERVDGLLDSSTVAALKILWDIIPRNPQP